MTAIFEGVMQMMGCEHSPELLREQCLRLAGFGGGSTVQA